MTPDISNLKEVFNYFSIVIHICLDLIKRTSFTQTEQSIAVVVLTS